MSMQQKAANAGLQSGVGAPNPQDVVPQDAGSPLPPELLSMIDNLPPEILEQLIAAAEAEMSQAGAGGPPQQGGPAEGQQDPNALIAKSAGYVEGFKEHAAELGFSKNDTVELYKIAMEMMQNSQVNEEQLAIKQAHYAGFMEAASDLGLSQQQALDFYAFGFGN